MAQLNLSKQIAQAEEAIRAGNARRHALFANMKASAKDAVKHRGKSLLFIAIGVAIAAIVLYPKRRQLSGKVKHLLNHPMADWVLTKLPLVGAVLPFFRTGQAMMRGGPMGIVSSLLPWLMGAFKKRSPTVSDDISPASSATPYSAAPRHPLHPSPTANAAQSFDRV